MQSIIIKIVVAIIVLIVISKYLAPLLVSLIPPFGLIILILLYVGVVVWLLGKPFFGNYLS